MSPQLAGETLNFVVYNYDNSTEQILGRTFHSLNPSSLKFDYDGAQIWVNEDIPVTLEVGSYSDPIEIRLDKQATQSLTLTPNLLDPNIIVTPFPIKIDLGEQILMKYFWKI
jgi:hypothetical protein